MTEGTNPKYELALTNREVRLMFGNLIHDWFSQTEADYNDFIQALLMGDVKAMNAYMNRVSLGIFSYFDTGDRPSGAEPERFYHGFAGADRGSAGQICDLFQPGKRFWKIRCDAGAKGSECR